MKNEPRYICVMGGCKEAKTNQAGCRRCGFEIQEEKRRKALPLIRGEDGLFRKHVGSQPEADCESDE